MALKALSDRLVCVDPLDQSDPKEKSDFKDLKEIKGQQDLKEIKGT